MSLETVTATCFNNIHVFESQKGLKLSKASLLSLQSHPPPVPVAILILQVIHALIHSYRHPDSLSQPCLNSGLWIGSELSKHLCSDVHEHHISGTDQQPATGLCSDYQTEHSDFEMGDTSVSLRSSLANDTVGQQQRLPPLTGSAAYRRSYDSLKRETLRDGVSALSGPRGFPRSSSADKGVTPGRRSSLLMQTTPGSQR